MIYVTSDLHGYPLGDFLALLRKVNFRDEDSLFILGDVVDRNGDGGVEMLEWLLVQPNVFFVLGNHEMMLLSCQFLFEEITDDSVRQMNADQLRFLSQWMRNGAEPTIRSLGQVKKHDPDQFDAVIEYLLEAPAYEFLQVNGRSFLLVHGGLRDFRPDRPLQDYPVHDLVWHRPQPDERYFSHILTVIGHTPTRHYGCPGRAFRTDTWIDIDTGAADGGAPMLLRLDDLAEFYADIGADGRT